MVSQLHTPSSPYDGINPVAAFETVFDQPMSLLLYGGGLGEQGRYSYLFANPAEHLIEADPVEAGDYLKQALASNRPGYWAGLLGYELASAFEPRLTDRVPKGSLALAWGRYEAVAIFDHLTQTLRMNGTEAAVEALADALSRRQPSPTDRPECQSTLSPVWDEEIYKGKATKARDYVAAGDVFQVNLSHRFTGSMTGKRAPLDVFANLTQSSPAGYAACLRVDKDRVIVTNSPEQFLSISPSGQITSRPIKGTRPRGHTEAEDLALKTELTSSGKDQAENLMIVDLMRNDLSRVCVPGSVSVPGHLDVESYANVHHLVSTIQGQLVDGLTIYDVLAASFPPGSITGAPKIRAMEIIAELEGEARGAYCGAMGFIAPDQTARLNVMIRTLSFERENDQHWSVTARSGGAITIDSDPDEELAETHAKLAALKSAMERAS